MKLIVNGDKRIFSSVDTVSALLEQIGINPKTIVVEQNGQIVMKDAYDSTSVEEGDELELIHFVGGG